MSSNALMLLFRLLLTTAACLFNALMTHVNAFGSINVMCVCVYLCSIPWLAIVMGPNLFRPTTDTNPMQALMVSQKAVLFLEHMIRKHAEGDFFPT